MNKVRFALYLERRQVAALRANEATTGAPVAEQIRRAIDKWLGATSKKRRTR
jgi:hypothetical protein